MKRVTYFEIPAENTETSKKFYSDVFGWEFNQFGENDYWLTQSNGSEKGIDGAVMKRNHPDQPLTITVEVDDLEEISKKIEKTGGTVVVPKMEIPGVGHAIFFKDPDGNILGAFEPGQDI